MQNDPAQVNQFGGTPANQLGTYPIPPSILADDHQVKLQAQNQVPDQAPVLPQAPIMEPTPAPVFSQITQTPLPQPESKTPLPSQPTHTPSLYQPEPQFDKSLPDEPTQEEKVKTSPAPLKLPSKNSNSLTPPVGSPEEADHYMNTLIKLIDHDKIDVAHTDLKQFDPSTLQDHYRILFEDYEIEISHGKAADSDKEFYVLLFNELENIQGVCTNKNILGYIHLSPAQFGTFKNSADGYLNKKKIAQEHDRFVKSLAPIDDYLGTLTAQLPVEAEAASDEQEYTDDASQDQSAYDDNGVDSSISQQSLDTPADDGPQAQAVYDPNQIAPSDQPDDNNAPVPAAQLDETSPEQAGDSYNNPYLPN